MFVAHPDDETFLGFTALRFGAEMKPLEVKVAGGLPEPLPCGTWKVICVTNASPNSSFPPNACRQDRRPEFGSAMSSLGAHGEMWDFQDGLKGKGGAFPRSSIKTALLGALGERNWESVVTHGAKGESGHVQHKELHELVRAAAEERYTDEERRRVLVFEQTPSTLLSSAMKEAKMDTALAAYGGRATVHLTNNKGKGAMRKWMEAEGFVPMFPAPAAG